VNSEKPPAGTSFDGWGIGGSRAPFMEVLGARPIKKDRGDVAFELVVEERHLRTLGIVHGGVTAAMLDTALGFAAGTTAPEGHHVVTVQLSLNFIRPAWRGERLIATGEVRHAGKMTAVARGELRTSEGALVASGTGTFMYLPLPSGTDREMQKQPETERYPTQP
jgi:acyl-CoA thioesterase